jgi:hypothetical protein
MKRKGMACKGNTWIDMEWQGKAWLGMVRKENERHGMT